MALFGVLGRRGMPIVGDGVYLRPSELRDYVEWSALREQSRAFLTPWEPVWPADDLTRTSFRYRVRRHAEEMARDEAYSFFVFRESDDVLLATRHAPPKSKSVGSIDRSHTACIVSAFVNAASA